MRLACLLAASAFALAACGGETDPTAKAATETSELAAGGDSDEVTVHMMLPDRLDCLRTAGAVLIVGHRGGPTRDYPENAIETFQRSFNAGTHAMEVDVRETKDGHLILMHDEDLERTTTGTGLVADHTLADVQKLFLETYSKVTEYHPPTLQAEENAGRGHALRGAVTGGKKSSLHANRKEQRGSGYQGFTI